MANQKEEDTKVSYLVETTTGESVSVYKYDVDKDPTGRVVGGLSFGKRNFTDNSDDPDNNGGPITGEIFYYNQLDYENVDYSKPSGAKATVKSGGCGVCSALMALNNSYGTEVMTVAQMAKFSKNCGARVEDGTDMSTLLNALSKKYKIKYKSSSSESELVNHLTNTGCAIINQGPSYPVFSRGGHFVVGLNIAKSKNIVRCLDPLMYDGKYAGSDNIIKRTKYGPWVSSVEIEKCTEGAPSKYFLITFTGSRNGQIIDVQNGDENLRRSNGKKVSKGVIKQPPSNLNQYGLDPDDYTNYNRNWASGTTQRVLYEKWKGKQPQSTGVAILGGCYLAAVTPAVGNVGDIVVVILKNGKRIPLIIGDQKGTDAKNKWGHTTDGTTSGPVSLVEWELAGQYGKTYAQSQHDNWVAAMKKKNWYRKDISYFINYGPYL